MHYSKYFKLPHRDFVKGGVFDGLIERDIPLHVDPMLLKNCKIPEFEGAYKKFLDYFNEIVTLTKGMTNPLIKNRCFKEIIGKMRFPEVVSSLRTSNTIHLLRIRSCKNNLQIDIF